MEHADGSLERIDVQLRHDEEVRGRSRHCAMRMSGAGAAVLECRRRSDARSDERRVGASIAWKSPPPEMTKLERLLFCDSVT